MLVLPSHIPKHILPPPISRLAGWHPQKKKKKVWSGLDRKKNAVGGPELLLISRPGSLPCTRATTNIEESESDHGNRNPPQNYIHIKQHKHSSCICLPSNRNHFTASRNLAKNTALRSRCTADEHQHCRRRTGPNGIVFLPLSQQQLLSKASQLGTTERYPVTQFPAYCESIFRLLLKIAVGWGTRCVYINFWNHLLFRIRIKWKRRLHLGSGIRRHSSSLMRKTDVRTHSKQWPSNKPVYTPLKPSKPFAKRNEKRPLFTLGFVRPPYFIHSLWGVGVGTFPHGCAKKKSKLRS